MADNTVLAPGAGGDTIRDILKGVAKTQVVTLDLGGAGAEQLVSGSIPVTGTFATETGGNLSSINTKTPSLGQAASAASSPVVIASDQPPIVVTTTATISTVNSTTTPLTASATFTGTAENIVNMAAIDVMVFSDQAGTVYVDYSTDGTNWDYSDVFPLTASLALTVQNEPHGKFYRLRIVNGGVNQTVLRAQCVLQPFAPTQNKIQVGDTILADDTAILTKGVITGKTTAGGGSYVDVKVNPSGALTAAVTAADGDVFVRSTTAANFNATVSQSAAAWTTKPDGTTWSLTGTSANVNVTNGSIAVTNAGLTNIDVALSTRLKPADTLAGVTTVGAVTSITNALPTGTNSIGQVTANQPAPTYYSSTATMAAGATVTSTVFDTSNGQCWISYSAYSITPLTVYFDESPDGTNWPPIGMDTYQVGAGMSNYSFHKPAARFCRVRFVNSGNTNPGGIANLLLSASQSLTANEADVSIVDAQGTPMGSQGKWTTLISDGTYTVGVTPRGELGIDSDDINDLVVLQTQMLQEIRALRLQHATSTGYYIEIDDLDQPWAQ